MAMNEAKKRDFVKQMITLIASNQAKLTEKGFDPTTQLGALQTSSDAASTAEVGQQEAKAALKAATANSVSKLSEAYKMASNFADLISGLFGKDDEIVQEIRKMRK
jgi:hypothetical protein